MKLFSNSKISEISFGCGTLFAIATMHGYGSIRFSGGFIIALTRKVRTTGRVKMDTGLLKELGLVDTESLEAIAYAQACVLLYEQTIRAMGLLPAETVSQAVENSQVVYMNPPEIGDEYANVPTDY